jgi:hypothetical protein
VNSLLYICVIFTKYASNTSIDSAKRCSPHPKIRSKCINDTWQALSGHHTQVREGQINDKHVCLTDKKLFHAQMKPFSNKKQLTGVLRLLVVLNIQMTHPLPKKEIRKRKNNKTA